MTDGRAAQQLSLLASLPPLAIVALTSFNVLSLRSVSLWDSAQPSW